jgi:hypothetical protein
MHQPGVRRPILLTHARVRPQVSVRPLLVLTPCEAQRAASQPGGDCQQRPRQATSWSGEGRILFATGHNAQHDAKSGKLNFGVSEIFSEIRKNLGKSGRFSDLMELFRISEIFQIFLYFPKLTLCRFRRRKVVTSSRTYTSLA